MRILASLFHPSGSWLFSGSERRFCALTEKWHASGHEIWALEPRPFAADSMVAGYQPVPVSVRGSNLGSQLFSWYLRAVSEGIATARRVGHRGSVASTLHPLRASRLRGAPERHFGAAAAA